MNKPRPKFFMRRIFPSLFLLAGAIILAIGINRLLIAKASTNWPTTTATISSSTVATSLNDGSTNHQALVHYTYEVNGTTHDSTRIAFGQFGSSFRDYHQKIVDQYPQNSSHPVSYSPQNPANSVLQPGILKQAYYLPTFGLVFIAVGIIIIIAMARTFTP